MRHTLPLLAALPLATLAFDDNGSYFQHKDWEIACDNTGTCRAAGYQTGDEVQAISLLLVRDAGADAAVQGRIAIQGADWDEKTARPTGGELYLDDNSLGAVTLGEGREGSKPDPDSYAAYGSLSRAQTDAALKAVAGNGTLSFRADKETWILSGAGAAAVLIKMDDYQGRVGTSSALIKRGSDKKAIPRPAKKPVIHAAAVPDTPPRVLHVGDAEYSALHALLAAKAGDDCPLFAPPEDGDAIPARDITLYPLNADNTLVGSPCFLAAYNAGDYYAILGSDHKTLKTVVGDSADGLSYDNGYIAGFMKVRGPGDCSVAKLYAWDGNTFTYARGSGSSQCKSFAGGAWELPTRVSTVIAPKKP
ncbi:DUF1176 domain-containing protein [uncultured Cardiobacterium sp.]|uniref:DUF1176 domain-containing protein n=1 Tax=uncultured Cardiobacterium sp. TaxID=417619 RepID=UPI00262D76E9|nr:DUF1176 domain-containing protein [uncultured Cardiobacterium sp.]